VTWLLLASACREQVPLAPLPFEVAGCDQIAAGPVCRRYQPGPITVWVEGEAPPAVELDGFPVSGLPWEEREGGFLAQLRCETPECVLRWTTMHATATLRVITEARPEAIDRAVAALATGNPTEAWDELQEAMSQESGPQWCALAWARIRLGDPRLSYAALETEAASRLQWWWATRAAVVQAHEATANDHDPAAARAAVHRARRHQAQLGATVGFTIEHQFDVDEAFVHQAEGDHRHALAAFERAELRARRLGQTDAMRDVRRHRAQSLIRAGQPAEALAVLQADAQALSPDENPCRASAVFNHLAWAVIQLREADTTADLPEPVPLLDEALRLLRRGGCGDAFDLQEFEGQTRVNRAIVALWDGDSARARAEIVAVRSAAPNLQELWIEEVEARIALQEGNPKAALEAYSHLRELAGAQLEFQFLAELGSARALADLGRIDDAIASLERAQGYFFREGRLIPLHLGQSAFYAQREQATTELAELHLARGHVREAFDSFRNQRAQYLAGLQQASRTNAATEGSPAWGEHLSSFYALQRERAALQAAWDTSLDRRERQRLRIEELERQAIQVLDEGYAALGLRLSSARRRPEPGEVLLGWFAGRDGWVGFAEDAAGAEAARWPAGEPPPRDELVAPFAAKLRRARRATLFPFAGSGSSDVHLALADGQPLVRLMPVRVGLDVALAGPPSAAARTALVVADPRSDLPGAAASAVDTAASLKAQGFTVRTLLGTEATHEALLAALPEVDLFDYSGHARAGSGWGSTIALADDAELSIADILTLTRTPRIAVLNGCGTAQQQDAGTLGIAQAFAAAGSSFVIATSRPVADALATAFSAHLYRELGRTSAIDEAYRLALGSLAAGHPAEDWPTFLLITP
jgi:tetratricopeptide (TPR) repeat protein